MTKCIDLDIAIRAYTEVPGKTAVGSKPPPKGHDTPSQWVLVFDTETTTCAEQALRVGSFQVRKQGEVELEGFFYDPKKLSDWEIQLLTVYALAGGFEVLTVDEFRELFLVFAYKLRATVVGFNLPFDLSRIALSHSEARGSMRGGFSFKLSPDKRWPSLRIKHLSRRAALIDFAKPRENLTPRGMRKRGRKVRHHRGYFLDLKTLSAALTSRSFSLASLCAHFETKTRKAASDEHGRELTNEYLDYARDDVQTTWECYEALIAEYNKHGLAKQPHRILSEASIGKAYLEEMGIQPLLACKPDFPRGIFGSVMSAYYGGRAEIRIRRKIKRVLYCDFKSMYPTVNILMGLWKFVISKDMETITTTSETQKLLNRITTPDMMFKGMWQYLTTYVRVKPDCDLFPVRAKYDGKSNTIGLNYLTCDGSLWFTLADCIAAKLLSGKTPIIEEAITFNPGEPHHWLQPNNLFGRGDFRIHPGHQDGFKQFVELRDKAKKNKDSIQQAIKIIANATSYGIFIEINRDDAPKGEPIDVFGPDAETGKTTINSKALEEPGKYFNPIIGTLITGAARLMLAIAERRVLDAGLEWVFCDTDSIAIAKPENMDEDEFMRRANDVVAKFEFLNPYNEPQSVLQIEDVNNSTVRPRQNEPLFAFAISAKRYALFNLDDAGRPIIRKASAHGLGHLMPPYEENDAPADIPTPTVPLSEIGVSRWQYDLWYKIIEAALNGLPAQVALDYHPALQRPAASRYGATSPRLLKWFDRHNEGRDYSDQVKPFGFLLSFQARNGLWRDFVTEETSNLPGRGRPKKIGTLSPVAPFDRDPNKAAQQAFDRETGEPVAVELLKTYAECLAQYHLSPEAKFGNGDYMDHGFTERRHVVATNVRLIGKEGNRVEEDGLEQKVEQLEFRPHAPDKPINV